MPKISKNIMKNMRKNKLIIFFLFFNSIIIAQKTNVIDSLYFYNDLGRKHILYVKENNASVNRIVEIYSVIKNKKLLIAQNKNLILCEECGGMRGDPYISVGKNQYYGFTIYLDNNEIEFKPLNNNFALVKSQFIQIMNTEIKKRKKKIKTRITTYTPKKIIYFSNYSIEILEKKCLKQTL